MKNDFHNATTINDPQLGNDILFRCCRKTLGA